MGHTKWPGTHPGSYQLPGGRCCLRGRIASDFDPQQGPSQGFLKGCELVQDSSQLSRNNLHPWKALKPKGSLTSRTLWKTGLDLFLSHFPRLLFYFPDVSPHTQSSNTDYISATLQSWDMKSCWVSPVQCHPKRWGRVGSQSSVITKGGRTDMLFSLPFTHSSIPPRATFPVVRKIIFVDCSLLDRFLLNAVAFILSFELSP